MVSPLRSRRLSRTQAASERTPRSGGKDRFGMATTASRAARAERIPFAESSTLPCAADPPQATPTLGRTHRGPAFRAQPHLRRQPRRRVFPSRSLREPLAQRRTLPKSPRLAETCSLSAPGRRWHRATQGCLLEPFDHRLDYLLRDPLRWERNTKLVVDVFHPPLSYSAWVSTYSTFVALSAWRCC